MSRILQRPPFMLISNLRGLTPSVAFVRTLEDAARHMQLDEADVRFRIEDEGRCDTDSHILIPTEPT